MAGDGGGYLGGVSCITEGWLVGGAVAGVVEGGTGGASPAAEVVGFGGVVGDGALGWNSGWVYDCSGPSLAGDATGGGNQAVELKCQYVASGLGHGGSGVDQEVVEEVV